MDGSVRDSFTFRAADWADRGPIKTQDVRDSDLELITWRDAM